MKKGDVLDDTGYWFMFRVLLTHREILPVLEGRGDTRSASRKEAAIPRGWRKHVEVAEQMAQVLGIPGGLPPWARASPGGLASFVGRYAPHVYHRIEALATIKLERRQPGKVLALPPATQWVERARADVLGQALGVPLPKGAEDDAELWTQWHDRNQFAYVRRTLHPAEMDTDKSVRDEARTHRGTGEELGPTSTRAPFSVTRAMLAEAPAAWGTGTATVGPDKSALDVAAWYYKDLKARQKALALWSPSKDGKCATCTGILWHSSTRALRGLPPVCLGVMGPDRDDGAALSTLRSPPVRMPPPGQDWNCLCIGRSSGIVLPTASRMYESRDEALGRLTLPKSVAGLLYYAKGEYRPEQALAFSVEQKYRKAAVGDLPSYGLSLSPRTPDNHRVAALMFFDQVWKERRDILHVQARRTQKPAGQPPAEAPEPPQLSLLDLARRELKEARKALTSPSSDSSFFERDAEGRTKAEAFARRYWSTMNRTYAWWFGEDAAGTTAATRFAAQYAKNVQRTVSFFTEADASGTRECQRFWRRYKGNAERTWDNASERVAKTVSALDFGNALNDVANLISRWIGKPPPPPTRAPPA